MVYPRFRFTWLCLIGVSLVALACNANGQETATVDAPSFVIPETNDGLPGAGPIRRYDWFQNLWQRRRSIWATQVETDQGSVVFFGDSITQGWSDLDGTFGDLKVANRGISGDTTRGMLIRLQEDVLSLNPQGVVMLMGTNDLEEGAEPQTIADNVALILDEMIASKSDLPIVLCAVFPSSDSKKRPAGKIKEINRLFGEVVKERTNVTLLDTWTLFANADGDAKVEEFPDLLHPNDAGYVKWAAALNPIFATIGWTDTEADDFELEEGFVSLFNGHDLTGWGFRETSDALKASRAGWRRSDPNAPRWPLVEEDIPFAGKTTSINGRYIAKNGRLIVSTPSEGRVIQQLYTTEDFGKDFTLKLEFRGTPNADSGIYVREPQLQCRDFALAGPYTDLKSYNQQGWNEMVVVVTGNVAVCTCNGEVIEAALEVPDSGPIGLEGDRGQMEYRRIRIKMSE